MLVGRGTLESREFRRWWRSCKGQERKMWFKSPSSRPHSHTDESLMQSLAKCIGMEPLLHPKDETWSLPSLILQMVDVACLLNLNLKDQGLGGIKG
ncbi:hypothetical protein EVAR_93449_1 [Eumeta japonica]|uniref:Uncharacterized protein n=1 Tax=Eumeta variegata TaxID=151549 RepID=A0A4C1TMJ5_EUMVA|nr:hypothetical protein EVAR_93449_1 [Eumeta japonica]